MPNMIERVQAEYDELMVKLNAMSQFLLTGSELVEPSHRELMVKQQAAMLAYAEILMARLKLLGVQ